MPSDVVRVSSNVCRLNVSASLGGSGCGGAGARGCHARREAMEEPRKDRKGAERC